MDSLQKIKGIWILDNGLEFRYYHDSNTLAKSLFDGYGLYLNRSKREPSLQWFGVDGHADASIFLTKEIPSNSPDDKNDPIASDAQARYMLGDMKDWKEILKKTRDSNKTARKELAKELEEFRLKNIS